MSSIKNFKKSITKKSKDNKLSKRFLPKSTKLKSSKKIRIGGMDAAAVSLDPSGAAPSADLPSVAVADAAPASLPDVADPVPVELTKEQMQFIVGLADKNKVIGIDDEYINDELFDKKNEDLKRNLTTYFSDIQKGFEKYFGQFAERPKGDQVERFKKQFLDKLNSFIEEIENIKDMLTQSKLPHLGEVYHLDSLRLLLSQYNPVENKLNSMTLPEFVEIMAPEIEKLQKLLPDHIKKCEEYYYQRDTCEYSHKVEMPFKDKHIYKAKIAPKGCYQFSDEECSAR